MCVRVCVFVSGVWYVCACVCLHMCVCVSVYECVCMCAVLVFVCGMCVRVWCVSVVCVHAHISSFSPFSR